MDVSTRLHLTRKGEDEVKLRTHKLSMRKRSVLILLDQPKTVDHVLLKSVFPRDQIIDEIALLIGDGFISLNAASDSVSVTAAAAPTAPTGSIDLDDEIIVSEAKFLLKNFVVDSFGTQAQALSDQIQACRSVPELRLCLGEVFAAAQRKHPDRLPTLFALIGEINATA